MEHLIPFLSGLIGTMAMTIYIELLCVATKRPYHVIRILANMLQFKPVDVVSTKPAPAALVVAVFLHFAIGIAFSYIYYNVTEKEILTFSYPSTLLFGAIVGVVGILGWRIFIAFHPYRPKISLPTYFIMIWAGHVILSIAMFFVYQFRSQ